MPGRVEYVLYADESTDSGSKFSNFYGGSLVLAEALPSIVERLEEQKAALNLHGEVKWQKVTRNYVAKYEQLIGAYFDLVESGSIRVRVMFTQNRRSPSNLTVEQRENEYFILYYQFVKHAFGFAHSDVGADTVRLRIYLDTIPNALERRARFRSHLASLALQPQFRARGFVIEPEQIAEVDSRDHVILQCTDVVLGAMQFRLNEKHRVKPEGARIRGSRTRAKEDLYRSIRARILRLHPGFNIGITTGQRDGPRSRWVDPYRHWLFQSRDPDESE